MKIPSFFASHLEYRAEGRTLAESIRNGIAYLRKYREKRYGTSESERRFFAAERERIAREFEKRESEGWQNASSLQLLGDLMWIRDGWDDFLEPALLTRLARSELVFGNLETVISDHFPVRSQFPDYLTYNSPKEYLRSFRRPDGKSLFSALSLSNNHLFDYGERGAHDTKLFLSTEGIPSSGLRQGGTNERSWTEHTTQAGVRVGFLAYGWGSNGFDTHEDSAALTLNVIPGIAPEVEEAKLDLRRIRLDLKRMREEGIEFIVLSLHWGYEYEYYPDPKIRTLGRRLLELGADCILGHHPHLQQPPEIVELTDRRGVIFYSVGNFSTTMYTEACRLGLAQELLLRRQAGKIEWTFGRTTWVYNHEKDPRTGKRSLVWLTEESHADEVGDESDQRRSAQIRATWEWTKAHTGLPSE